MSATEPELAQEAELTSHRALMLCICNRPHNQAAAGLRQLGTGFGIAKMLIRRNSHKIRQTFAVIGKSRIQFGFSSDCQAWLLIYEQRLLSTGASTASIVSSSVIADRTRRWKQPPRLLLRQSD